MAKIIPNYLIFSAILFLSPTSAISLYTSCSPIKYPPHSPFHASLAAVLSSAVDAAVTSPYSSLAAGNTTSSPPGAAAYAIYQCRRDMKGGYCPRCVAEAVAQMGAECPLARGGAIQLDGCYLRYESSDDFIGVLEFGVMYDKCSLVRDNDQGFLRRRDEVVGVLAAAAQGFVVTSSGNVHGVALCTGDLNLVNCSTCMAMAVANIKSICGYVLAAQVFLPKCYARYWASGFYTDSSGGDDVGKTVAIIAGTVAGVVVIIVFLSFCRRAMG